MSAIVEHLGSATGWNDFYKAVGTTEKELNASVAQILRQEVPTSATLRLLPSGRSGARVAVLSYTSGAEPGQATHHWLLKVFPPEARTKLQIEERATRDILYRLKRPIDLRIGLPHTLAFPLARDVDCDLLNLIQRGPSNDSQQFSSIVYDVFAMLGSLHNQAEISPKGFFDCYTLRPETKTTLAALGFSHLLSWWQLLEKHWQTDRGTLCCVCHGDLNPTNILLSRSAGGQIAAQLIDFASSDRHHWAWDFARLERQIRFVLELQPKPDDEPNRIAKLASATDLRFDIPPDCDAPLAALVSAVRLAARNWYSARVGKFLEYEYFLMLAFQQLCLLTSTAWDPHPEIKKEICLSTQRILAALLQTHATDYVFGYFSREIQGREEVLARVSESGNVDFTFESFAVAAPVGEVAERTVANVAHQLGGADVLKFDPDHLQISQIIPNPGELFLIPQNAHPKLARLYFAKLPIKADVSTGSSREYKWVRKTEFFQQLERLKGLEPDSPRHILYKAVRHDRLYVEFGRVTLECVDVLVFRHPSEGPSSLSSSQAAEKKEFLLLHRNNRKEKFKGWEYPKGGCEYHETVREAAMREVLEETGVCSPSLFCYLGELDVATVDVSWRRKPYQAVRVHATAVFYYGDDENIRLNTGSGGGEGHTKFEWMAFSDARREVWMEYGKRFFDSWKSKSVEILRPVASPVSITFQVTDQCPSQCQFCLRYLSDTPGRPMDIDRCKHTLDILASRGVLRVTFSGGEPFFDEITKLKTVSLIRHAHARQIHTCLSTTGYNVFQKDLRDLEPYLDQVLLSLHTLDPGSAGTMYKSLPGWRNNNANATNVMRWLRKSPIKLEVSTVASQANLQNLGAVGKAVFGQNPNAIWRVDEYYANGNTESNRAQFELKTTEFKSIQRHLKSEFSAQWEKRQIRFSSKETRMTAPDIMVTADGKLVTSSNNKYTEIPGEDRLITIELQNRRRWEEYRNGLRSDWDW
jgi:MoaA/NifB/PqqE/SkfB family radical SAM enzyme/8-oxo-dGTP pyrophosphatase MutT (NUDIX family)